jgi:succinate-semialdehyde dehydrogenase/glutarate-semialdehyde dehydrogenase
MARLILAEADRFATVLTSEQGKPLAQARAEVLATAEQFDWYADEARRIYGRVVDAHTIDTRILVRREPVGPVAAFTPWNFPVNKIVRKLAAALAAGCSVVVKAPEETPASPAELLRVFVDAGVPAGTVNLVFGDPAEISAFFIAHPAIRKISFTGSTAIGKQLASLAGLHMKRTTMELGGHGPVLVFGDADMDRVLDTVVTQKYRNAGQVCVSPTRFIVEESVYGRFRDAFAERARAITVGNGMDEATRMGPMANPRRPEAMDRLISDAVQRGARLHTGGERVGNAGFFYAPSVLSDIPLDALVMNEEPFGPVALINAYAGEEAMIAEANRLPYGLAAFAWTTDGKRQQRLAREIEAGMVGINTNMIAGADSPFGGVRWSGHGAEDGPEGVLACMVTKAVHEG